jgi:hypothetical protein
MKVVFECHNCGTQASPSNLFTKCSTFASPQAHLWKAYPVESVHPNQWVDNDTGELIKDYIFEVNE